MRKSLNVLAAVVSVGAALAGPAAAADWVHWRGPEQTGVARDTGLPEAFGNDPADPKSNLLWRRPFGGRSTPLVMNHMVYVIGDVGQGLEEQERVVCCNADTGEKIWEQRFNVFLTDIVSSRVGWTNLAGDPETGNVYAHGVQGLLICFDGKTGKHLWEHSLTEEDGRISGYGGRVTSPTVDGDLLIIGMVNSAYGDQVAPANRFLALDKKTGVPVWWSQPAGFRGTYYSSPVVTVINGERQLICGGSDGTVFGMKVRTGERVWSYQLGGRSINSSPVVAGTRVYVGHGEENEDTNEKGRFVCLDAGEVTDGKPKEVWKVNGLRASYASPIIHENRLYIPDEYAAIHCLDPETGKRIWKYKYGTVSKGSPVFADGKIYVAEVPAHFYILKPEEKRCKELHNHFFRSPDGNSFVEINGSPAVADGKIYFTTRDELLCVGKKGRPPETVKIPAQPDDGTPEADAKAAAIQVIPAEVSLRAGESAEFKVRAFDAKGRFLREVKATWSLPAPPVPPAAKVGPPPLKGTIDADGKLTVAKEMINQQGPVEATFEGLTKRARVRVLPDLPVKQDFEKVPVGRVPGGWVNCAGKFEVAEKDGSKVLKKLANNPNPALARGLAFIGRPTLTDYTIAADVQGATRHNEMPDVGLLANRYQLTLEGTKQRLRIISWEAMPRVDKTIAFAWKPDVWYRMKFRVDVAEKSALVRGKVWVRGEPEPADWTVTFEDPVPNRQGSPGLYGYAYGILPGEIGTEVYFDNVSVVPNKDATTGAASR